MKNTCSTMMMFSDTPSTIYLWLFLLFAISPYNPLLPSLSTNYIPSKMMPIIYIYINRQVIENLAYQVNVSADAGNGAPTNEQITGYMIDMIEAVADKAGFT